MSVLIFIIILAVLVLSHEFGHFIVAKKSGIKVEEFGFGFPPKIFSFKWGETVYSVNLIPFGGFVKIFGEDQKKLGLFGLGDAEKERSFISKPKKIQAAVIAAGVFFNLLLAWFLLTVGFSSGMPMPVGSSFLGKEVTNPKVYVTGVLPNSPAQSAGLMPSDQINYIYDYLDNRISDPTTEMIQNFIGSRSEQKIVVGYTRGSSKNEIIVEPKSGLVSERAAIGVSMETVGVVKLPFFSAVWNALKATALLFYLTVSGFVQFVLDLFSGGSALANVAGPIGIIGIVKEAYGFGFIYLIGLTALISVNLAVLNLVPFPALDGGRLLFLMIEVLRKKPLNQAWVNGVNMVGFFILIFLMLLVTYYDLLKIFG